MFKILGSLERRVSCKDLFKIFYNLPLSSKILLSSLLSVVGNMEKFQTNSYTHTVTTKYNLHVLNPNLGKHEKRVYCTAIQ
jgi:hypothetical protein